MELTRLLKRGALVAAANWPTVVVQFLARTTYQALVATPVVGAAILVALLLGGDLQRLLAGGLRDMFAAIAGALLSEPAALTAFAVAVLIALLGATALMALVKGGAVTVLIRAEADTGPLEVEPLFLQSVGATSRTSLREFIHGAARLFRRFLAIGLLQLVTYGVSVAVAVAFLAYAYRAVEGRALLVGWALIATLTAGMVTLGITIVNLLAVLMQIAIASGDLALFPAAVKVARFIRVEARSVGGVFLVLLLMVVIATLASALAWSGVALVAFVPLVGLAVVPLQIAALVVRGIVFEYIGLTGLAAYATLFRRHAEDTARADARASYPGRAVTAAR